MTVASARKLRIVEYRPTRSRSLSSNSSSRWSDASTTTSMAFCISAGEGVDVAAGETTLAGSATVLPAALALVGNQRVLARRTMNAGMPRKANTSSTGWEKRAILQIREAFERGSFSVELSSWDEFIALLALYACYRDR